MEQTKKGRLIVISGPSGSGKGVVSKLVSQKTGIPLSVSATTRAPREEDVPGKTYHFISREEFESRIRNGGMLEYNCYNGNYYGTPKKEVLEAVAGGNDVILEIDVHGGLNVRACDAGAILIMLTASGFSVQEKRLRQRDAGAAEDVIRARLDESRAELERLPEYDYLVINEENKAEECADAIVSILRGGAETEKYRVSAKPGWQEQYFLV